jgi:hypothetical protein
MAQRFGRVNRFGDGCRKPSGITHADALAYARAAAKAFGINPDRKIDFKEKPDREVIFDKVMAKQDLSGDGGDAGKKAQKNAKKAK